jgi:hypothetical protein
MMERPGYLDEYLAFWTTRPGIERVWLSLYTPQQGEVSAERLTNESRARLLRALPALKAKYPALIFPDGALQAFAAPPASPDKCTLPASRRTCPPTSRPGSSRASLAAAPIAPSAGAP